MLVRQLTKQLSRSLNTALSGIADAITKVFIDLSPTSNGFYSLGTDSVLTTAYKLGISAVLPTASTTYALFGKASDANNYLKILSSGYLSLDVDGTVVTSTVLATKDSEYREYSVTLSGNDFIFKENTTTISTVTNATAAAKTLTLNLIGKSNAGEFYLGIVADPVMGSLEFNLDQLTANFEFPVGNVVGSEEVSNNTFDNTTGWYSPRSASTISAASNKLRSSATSTGTFGSAIALTGLVIGKLYFFKGAATSSNSNAFIRLRITQDSGLNTSDSGDFESLARGNVSVEAPFLATATTMYMGTIITGHNAGDYVDIDSGVSIKSVTNVITYQNIGTGTDVRDTYTLIDDDYIGSELVINGDFATDSDWSITGESNISAGRANIYSSAGANTFIRQDAVMLDGLQYILEYEIISANSGDFKISSVSNSALSKEIGINTLVFNALGTSILLQRNAVELTDIVINNISIKRYIEVV